MTDFDLDAFVAHAETAAEPKGNFGAVFELYQEQKNQNALGLLAGVPDEHYDAAEAALKARGITQEIGEPEEGLCKHWLDANTCPCGCFE